ncbi:transcriptional regulator [Singulisphaera sp. GP187]|uniref:sugar-binding transcriptional regulator n=1 Tax=Singulisphaera sp. GP187 TaxID=1882752 RepID=UPI00092B85DD|nr:sugar-binding domain-containing protein [Singulisphaera sp. GP187]SIO66502.1 transcriptional regulator [Singulisphaera sp. GP187]
MSIPTYNDEQLILAARLYFLDGLPQAQIGKLVNVSQSKVSRMLALARERGLVRITVPEYDSRDGGLEGELRARLGVEAVVIRTVGGLRAEDLRQTIGYFAAPVISGWIESASRVAVAGGRTMQALVEQMKPSQPRHELTLLQAMGNIDSSTGLYDAVELGRLMARRWGGTFLTLSTPAILPDPETCRRFLGLEPIQTVMNQLGQADLAFVGIGTLANSVFLERNVLGPLDLATLQAAGAVGEVLGRFFDCHGNECTTPFQQRVVSLGLNELRRIPRKVGVVAGEDRTKAVLAAIEGGLLNALVINEAGASALLKETQ